MLGECARILVIDDDPNSLEILAALLHKKEYAVSFALGGSGGIQLAAAIQPDLILLDVIMPDIDGFETCHRLKANDSTKDIPVIFMTALTDAAHKVRGFECGAVDYLTKPINSEEVLARVNVHLKRQRIHNELKRQNGVLVQQHHLLRQMLHEQIKAVQEHAIKIQNMTTALINALEDANTLNDEDTGKHIERIGVYSAFLAECYGCDQDFVQRIRLYAPLHDVGKVGLPDALLKKSDKYTPEELVQIQQHVVFGAQLLNYPGIDSMARNIALYHHERWDGAGYVSHLSGGDIPLEARIVAISDVYDALVSKRVYKEAFTEEEAEQIIHDEAGSHFDPTLVNLFLDHKSDIRAIRGLFIS